MVQEPSFQAFQASADVRFVARKESRALAAKASVALLASNVAGQYGLHLAWRVNVGMFNGNPLGVTGLGNTTTVMCGPPPPCAFNTSCTTIWLQPTSTSCPDLSAIAITVNLTESDFSDETTASVALDLRAQGVPEGRYPFILHLPVANSTAWQHQPIPGALDVVGIADSALSEASVCQGAACAVMAGARFNSTNGGGVPLAVTIIARDADGFQLNRTGEAIAAVLRSSAGVAVQTIQAVYMLATQRYTAEIAGLTVAGNFSVAIQTPLGTDVKASFTVVCSVGYEAAPTGECVVPRSVCESATTSSSRLSFTANSTLQLSGLGSAIAVELLPMTQAARFEVRGGQASVVFERPGSFLVQVVAADGRACTLEQSRRVDCPSGYQAVGLNCELVLVEDVCAGLVVRDSKGMTMGGSGPGGVRFNVGDKLWLSSSKPASAYRFQLVPTQGVVTGDITDAIVLGQPGSFSLSAQYISANVPVLCPLIQALNVSAAQICDQIQAEFSLTNSTATGARSNLQVDVIVPAGAAAFVIATPLESTVRATLAPRSGSSSMMGSAMLPSTGLWSVAVGIGKEQCTRLSQTLVVECLNGFIDQRGQCFCPDGYVNVQGQCQVAQQRDPCQEATVRSSTSGTLPPGTASVILGTTLSVSVSANAATSTYKTLLIPKQGTESHDLSQNFAPNRTGTFSLDMEYSPAGGTPKRCTLLSSLTVQCHAGEHEVDGQCRAVTRSPCESASVNLALTDDAARGAGSLVKAAVRLPDGVSPTLIATPLESAVEVPVSQSGTLSGGMGTWEGSVSLPSTGAWALQLTIGRERCSETVRNITCTAGFFDDGAGRCVCPVGFENKAGTCVRVRQEVDICQLARVSSSSNETIRLQNSDTVALRPGTQLYVSFATPAVLAMDFETLLVPLQGTETRAITETIVLNRSGSFALKLQKVGSSKECSLIPKLEITCRQDEQEVAGQCQRCPLADGFWQDSNKQCKKKALMAVKVSSDRLLIVLLKTRSTRAYSTTIEMRLMSGDVESTRKVEWTASSTSAWLSLGKTAGTVSSDDPVARLDVVADATSMQDTYLTGPLNATLSFTSSLPNVQSDVAFEGGSHQLTMTAEVSIEAAVYLKPNDVEFQTSTASILSSGGEISAGDKLTLTVKVYDYERLAIPRRGLLLQMSLCDDNDHDCQTSDDPKTLKTATLLYLVDNTYRGLLPGDWIKDAGRYTVRVRATNGTDSEPVLFRLTVTEGNQQLYLKAGIAVVTNPFAQISMCVSVSVCVIVCECVCVCVCVCVCDCVCV
jgi:hypothetical protein